MIFKQAIQIVKTVRDGERRQEGGVNGCLNKFKYFSPVFEKLKLKLNAKT